MMGFLGVLFRIVLVLFVVRLGLRAAVQLLGPRRAPSPSPTRDLAVDLVRDRVCNTFLPRARAIHALVGGVEEHFCSTTCAQRALAESTGRA